MSKSADERDEKRRAEMLAEVRDWTRARDVAADKRADAIAVASFEGIAATEIAEAAGVSAQALYMSRWRSKREL